MQESGQPVFPARGLWYVVAPVLAYVAMQSLLLVYGSRPAIEAMVPQLSVDASVAAVHKQAWSEAAARMTLLGFVLLFVAATVGVIIKTVRDYIVLFDRPSKRNVLMVVGVVTLLSAITLVPGGNGLIPRYRDLFGKQLFVDAANAFPQGRWGATTLDMMAVVMNVSVTIATGCFALQVISCIGSFRNIAAGDSWKFQFDRLKFYTYLASTFMIIGLLMNRAWISYPMFLLSDDAAGSYRALVNSFTMYLGIAYTLIIGSIAIPVSYRLYVRANAIAAEIHGAALPKESEPFSSVLLEEQRRKAGLAVTPQDILKSIVAVLGPFVAGSVAGLPAFA